MYIRNQCFHFLHPMLAPQTYQIQELSEAQKDLIKASVPILELSGTELTRQFYDRMLSNYPEVRPFFNETNQITLKQPKILAFALLSYAKNIDDLAPLTAFVHQIVVKHVGLQIKPEHYPIVGSALLETMGELLGPDIATPEFIGAWATAYGNLAQLLINAEHGEYDKQAWHGFREFMVTKMQDEAADVKSVYFTPKDGGEIALPERGQYLGFRFSPPGAEFEKSREYSISEYPTGNEYRISVRKVDGGSISTYIHDALKVGDSFKVSPPAGQFVYKNTKKDLLVLAAGIGITPLISIVDQALREGKHVRMYYSNRSKETRPFATWLSQCTSTGKFTLKEFISTRICAADFDSMEAENKEIYMLGPVGYMTFVREQLQLHGASQINLEFFGPTAV